MMTSRKIAKNPKIEVYRDLVKVLVDEKILTYVEMAAETGISVDILKSFAIGRTRRPRNDFFDRLHKRIPELRTYRIPEKAAVLINELVEENGQENLPFQLRALGSVMGVSANQFKQAASKFSGEYACYWYAGKSKDIYKTKLSIHPFQEKFGVVSFTLCHTMEDGTEILTTGYGLPVAEKLSLIGRIAGLSSFVSISIENKISETHYSGIFLQSIGENSGNCSRVLLANITDHQDSQLFGVLKFVDVADEIRGYEQVIDNELGERELLRPYRPR